MSVIGHGVEICTTATRPASPSNGTLIFDTDTNQLLVRVGSNWVSPMNNQAVVFCGERNAAGGHTGTWIANTAFVNTNTAYNTSTGIFTVPVAGNYFCSFWGLGWFGAGYGYLRLKKNGSNYGPFAHWNASGSVSNQWSLPTLNTIVSCAKNDTLNFHVDVVNGNTGIYSQQHNGCSIQLIN